MAEINSFQIGSVIYDMRDERTKQNLASVFSTGVEYKAGDYAEYDTQLYQFIVDHPAGAWDASQVVAVNLAAGVSEALKSRENFSTKAPVILNTTSGEVVSFADGADDMPIKKIVGTIVPVQAGSGNPSPDNVRLISGWTGANIYNEETYDVSALPKLTINWQDEADTIYEGNFTLNEDGSVDVVRTHVVYDIQPSQWTWQSSSSCFSINRSALSPRYKVFGNNVDNRIPDIVCNKYKPNSFNNIANNRNSPNYSVGIREYNASWLALRTNGTNAISPEECQIKLPLATPQTYHFDNIGQLYTCLGINNIWIDTGAITECEYPADTKLFLTARDTEITGNIAPIENGTTASKAYAQGAYFWHDTKFCKALTAIASGATFTLGTNYQETTIAAELLAAQN